MAKKVDGIIEAVHYSSNGKIEFVRAYERRGASYSDRVLLNRETLLARLNNKKLFFVGQRKLLLAGTFDEGQPVKLITVKNKSWIVTPGQEGGRDFLAGTPLL